MCSVSEKIFPGSSDNTNVKKNFMKNCKTNPYFYSYLTYSF